MQTRGEHANSTQKGPASVGYRTLDPVDVRWANLDSNSGLNPEWQQCLPLSHHAAQGNQFISGSSMTERCYSLIRWEEKRGGKNKIERQYSSILLPFCCSVSQTAAEIKMQPSTCCMLCQTVTPYASNCTLLTAGLWHSVGIISLILWYWSDSV